MDGETEHTEHAMTSTTMTLAHLVLATLLATSCGFAQVSDDDDDGDLSARITPIVKAVERAVPSVVSISTERLMVRRGSPWDSLFQRNTTERNGRQRLQKASLGSGVIIDPKGYT